MIFFFFFQAEDGIRDHCVTGVQTCALPIASLTDDGRDELPLVRFGSGDGLEAGCGVGVVWAASGVGRGVRAGVAAVVETLFGGVGAGVTPALATAATSAFAAPKLICTLICWPSSRSTLLVLSGALGAVKSSL